MYWFSRNGLDFENMSQTNYPLFA